MTTSKKIQDEDLKKLATLFLQAYEEKYGDDNGVVAHQLDKVQNGTIEDVIVHIVSSFTAALGGNKDFYSAVFAAGIHQDLSMRQWVVLFYRYLTKHLLGTPEDD